ncbi:HlyD family secretion protein [Sphingomonas paeninsulae]|uniref:HlyD family secretion protein n=2 Tax=Sphingomonas paeninsulae TaxID=2319844 RepID=A0A494TN65_SPHPE|nr:HlyD family secretion protein [Sphingomonas paeninsulae]
MNEMSKIEVDAGLAAGVDGNDGGAQSSPRKSRTRLIVMLSVPAIIIVAALFFWLTSGKTVTTDNALINAPVVSIAPEVSGPILEVRVSENQVVKAGDLLFRIDPAPYRIALMQAEAAVSNARVQVAQLGGTANSKDADVSSKAADIAARASDVQLAEQTLTRQTALMKQGFTTRAQLDSAQAAMNAARQARAAAVAERQSALATAASARAALGTDADGQPPAVAAAMAQREKARLDLTRTEVRSPINGRVTQTDRLEAGNMATMSLPLVSIVGGNGYWIDANFKETQLAKVRIGQSAEVEIDAIPGHKFKAIVTGIGAGTGSQFSLLPAQNATGNWVKVTQRVPVRLTFTEKLERPLVAGWSAKVTVRVAD